MVTLVISALLVGCRNDVDDTAPEENTVTPPTDVTNPLPISVDAFLEADVLFAIDSVEADTGEAQSVEVRGVIDVAGDSPVRTGDTILLEWPYRIGQASTHRRLVIPVEKVSNGRYRATSGGQDERWVVRRLAGLPYDDADVREGEVADLFEQADAVGSYVWTEADIASDGLTVKAGLDRTVKGSPPKSLNLTSPPTQDRGGPWTFYDGSEMGATFGYVFLKHNPDGSWESIAKQRPWNFSERTFPNEFRR